MTTSAFFDAHMEPFQKKARKIQLSAKDRENAWSLHHGPHAKEAQCPMCDFAVMRQKDKGGWECAHIVSENFCIDPRSVYNLLPCCAACNKETGTECIFNVMMDRHRLDVIKRVCTNIFQALQNINAQRITFFEGQMWKVIRELFGYQKHKAGGGISVQYEPIIYTALLHHQLEIVQKDMQTLHEQLQSKGKLCMRLLQNTNVARTVQSDGPLA